MSRLLRTSSLSIFFLVLFLVALIGQALTGWAQFNDQQTAQNLAEIGLGRYLRSADFAVDVTENWQSEYLQFLLYILAAVFFVQRGSPESPDQGGLGSDQEQKLGSHTEPKSPTWAKAGGTRTALYSWSLTLVMGSIFLVSWLAQSIAGWAAFNETRMQQFQDPLSWGGYLANPDFWARTLQNWQSEFLAVGSMAVLAIYLRQRGSAESKPVGEPHDSTGDSAG
jgi:hypothetical protein